MSDMEEKVKRFIALEQDNPERWWWLSFADGDLPKGRQFLGACLVQGRGLATAISNSHALGCNPGGSCQGLEAPESFSPRDGWTNRLLSRAECEEFDRLHMVN